MLSLNSVRRGGLLLRAAVIGLVLSACAAGAAVPPAGSRWTVSRDQNPSSQRLPGNVPAQDENAWMYEPPQEELTEEEINQLFDEALNWDNEAYLKELKEIRNQQEQEQREWEEWQKWQGQQQPGQGTGGNLPGAGGTGPTGMLKNRLPYPKSTRDTMITRTPIGELLRRMPRYGMNFFRQPPSTYAPLDSVPVTPDYILGPDDEMTITLWGIPEEGSYPIQIGRDGMAIVPHIGAVRLAGYNLNEARRVLHARFDQYFTGYQLNVSMGSLRSIMVYVTGNVRRPGAYTVSSFATLVNALLASGGPSEAGSMRRIELKRGSRTVTTFDMYAMLLKGDKTQDVRLEAGDVIFVPPAGPLVGLAGEVRNPGVYELNGSTRVKDLLYIAGGMNAQTFKGRIQYFKVYNQAYRGALEGSFSELAEVLLEDGDVLRLFPVMNFTATANVTGKVFRPGTYAVSPGQSRVMDLINQAGGLMPTAADRAELTRVTPSQNGPVNERFTIDLRAAMRGEPTHNLTLERNDRLTVLVIPEWDTQKMVTITGEVMRPGTYAMLKGERLSDLITRAGGFTKRAHLKGAVFTRVSVAEEQKEALDQMADQMERDMLSSQQNIAGGDATAATATANNAELERRRELINRLRDIDIMGRVIVRLDVPQNIKDTVWDFELQDGDALKVPEVPLTVNVMGAVYASTSQLYNPAMGINGYVNAAGGAVKIAHKRMLYLLKSDGTVVRLTRSTAMFSSKEWRAPHGFSAAVEPGDTIVVPVKYLDSQSFDSLRDTIDIIYKVAVAAGVFIK
ncbi:MAG: SLBB domain-containing protein [Fretibacterium sp.]|nr:SLBB domain-containing protein [Fretibacterium sp.]